MKNLAWAAQQRQNYIGDRLRNVGTLNRFDIETEFGISAAQASIDIAYFISIYPDVMRYDKTLKSYVYLGEQEEKASSWDEYVTVDEHHQVRLKIGVQSFKINEPCEDNMHALWMKKMLVNALKTVTS